MRTATCNELQNNINYFFDGVVFDSEPLLVQRAGAEAVVVISLSDYNAMSETEFLMRSPAMMQAISQGEDDIRSGKSIEKKENESMEEFLKRCIK